MKPGRRINLIRESATLLARCENFREVDLILGQFDLPITDSWQGDSIYGYVIDMIERESNEKLQELHAYLTGEGDTTSDETELWKMGRLMLFMSHVTIHRKFVGNVANLLAGMGINAFVAHNAIEPSVEWQNAVETTLRRCHAMVAFLHDGFDRSKWCDQEVGFALARRIPILPVQIDMTPYGFFGRFQAASCSNKSPRQISDIITEWLFVTPSVRVALADGFVYALENSKNYDQTRQIIPLLQRVPQFTPDQLKRLGAAIQENVQVENAFIGNSRVPNVIKRLIEERGGAI